MKPLSDLQAIKTRIDNLLTYLTEAEDTYFRSMLLNINNDIHIIEKHVKSKEGLKESNKSFVEGYAVLNICDHPLNFITNKGINTVWPCGFTLPQEYKMDSRFKEKVNTFHIGYPYIRLIGTELSSKYYDELVIPKPSGQFYKGNPLYIPEFEHWTSKSGIRN